MSKEVWLRRSCGVGSRVEAKEGGSSCAGLFPKVNPKRRVSLASQPALYSVRVSVFEAWQRQQYRRQRSVPVPLVGIVWNVV